jgi:hypothetical protein
MSLENINSKGVAIWNEIIRILTAGMALPTTTPGNIAYVKAIWQGYRDRENIPLLPAIIIEPVNEREKNYTVPMMKQMTLIIAIDCWSDNYGDDKQIIGDAASVGIMDFARDVKNLINAEPNLNQEGNATMIRFPDTQYPPEAWPNRLAEITMEIDYLAQATTR